MKFTVHKKIRFHHCDPAGIVFYPQFFYLLHEVQEDFLTHIGHPEHALIAGGTGIPIVNLTTDFVGMCRFGDRVSITLHLTKLGGASIGMHYEIHSEFDPSIKGKTLKLRADSVVVCSEMPHGKAIAIPDALREALLPYLETPQETKP